MKKVFLAMFALAVVATSCKKSDAKAEATVDEAAIEAIGEEIEKTEAAAAEIKFEDINIDQTLADYAKGVDDYIAGMKAGTADRYNDFDKFLGATNLQVVAIGENIDKLNEKQSQAYWDAINKLQNYYAEQDLGN